MAGNDEALHKAKTHKAGRLLVRTTAEDFGCNMLTSLSLTRNSLRSAGQVSRHYLLPGVELKCDLFRHMRMLIESSL
jgi:hypothetical protein